MDIYLGNIRYNYWRQGKGLTSGIGLIAWDTVKRI